MILHQIRELEKKKIADVIERAQEQRKEEETKRKLAEIATQQEKLAAEAGRLAEMSSQLQDKG